ncbi:CBS domain-containing protein [Dyella japonica]|uniref:CBS domain-containing protein n=1 Tax=Dyella japonica TaxID=231455 RepID=A0ABV2JS55_9GAMM
MKVRDIMSPKVQLVRDTDNIGKAMHLMLDGGFSGLPVVNSEGALVGMLTEGDFIRRAETGTAKRRSFWQEFLLGPDRLARDYAHANGRVVEEIMAPEVYWVEADAPLEHAVALMDSHGVKRLPVLDAGRLVGVLSRSDLMRACLRLIESDNGATVVGDALIKARIDELFARQPWAPRETVHVEVARGEVDLCGVITSESTRDALRVLAENVPGVVKVHDKLTTIESMSGCIVRTPV